MSTRPGQKAITIWIDEDKHRAFKVYAASLGVTMTDLMDEKIDEILSDDTKNESDKEPDSDDE